MSFATFDNPATCCREAWQDGKLVAHISFQLILTPGFRGYARMHMGLNVGRDIQPGTICGDIDAIAEEYRPTVSRDGENERG